MALTRGPLRALAIGFGTTVAMWVAGYVCRLPYVMAPAGFVLALVLSCQLLGGVVAGRFGGSFRAGALPALVSSVLNLLVLGSFLSSDRPALVWVPGSILVSLVLGTVGAWLGSLAPKEDDVDWLAVFVRVDALATFFLLIVGGLVTSNDAGLAVADWPSSYGYNMFLYPFARMTGGIYFEHAHRLFGSLVGLTTLVLAILLVRYEPRRGVRRLGVAALVLVVAQGILGGLRVTETNIALAVVHGVTAQVFFATLVAISVLTCPRWREGSDLAPAPVGRLFVRCLVGAVLAQLVLGALLRHLDRALHPHIAVGVLVGALAVIAGAKTGAGGPPVLRRPGWTLLFATVLQIALGIGAFVTTRILEPAQPGAWDVALATAHQGMGAVVLACSVVVLLWTERLACATSS
jgi:cytochrome c oxidase assembly protein subunit 15